MSKPADYLRDLLTELSDVETFTKDGLEAFTSNRMAQKAVTRSYEVIGEIVKRLPTEVRAMDSGVNWKELAAFRDFLSHRYDRVSIERLWNAVIDLPNLRQAVQTLIEQLESPLDNDDNRTD